MYIVSGVLDEELDSCLPTDLDPYFAQHLESPEMEMKFNWAKGQLRQGSLRSKVITF